ncbi:hypothetical protein [Tateyamaria sp. SN6-1]|uniref:hypothetical protein n=1 Tax=Tateyamaria sp. SN6-1 TaxID=3092148 RepID=UPI0039F4C6F0
MQSFVIAMVSVGILSAGAVQAGGLHVPPGAITTAHANVFRHGAAGLLPMEPQPDRLCIGAMKRTPHAC